MEVGGGSGSGRPSSSDRARIRRAMRSSSRRLTAEVRYVPPPPSSTTSSPSNAATAAAAIDPLRSQSQPPSGDASARVRVTSPFFLIIIPTASSVQAQRPIILLLL